MARKPEVTAPAAVHANPIIALAIRNGYTEAQYDAAMLRLAEMQRSPYASMHASMRQMAALSALSSGMVLKLDAICEFGQILVSRAPNYAPQMSAPKQEVTRDANGTLKDYLDRLDSRVYERPVDEQPTPDGGISLGAVQSENDRAFRS